MKVSLNTEFVCHRQSFGILWLSGSSTCLKYVATGYCMALDYRTTLCPDKTVLHAPYVYKGDFLWRSNKKDDAKKAYQEAMVWDNTNVTAKERIQMQ